MRRPLCEHLSAKHIHELMLLQIDSEGPQWLRVCR